jgi:hypothetical protein
MSPMLRCGVNKFRSCSKKIAIERGRHSALLDVQQKPLWDALDGFQSTRIVLGKQASA